MGISERRARERDQRRAEILRAAWLVADRDGWSGFSVERVAAQAELGRATVYGYFDSLEVLVLEMAREALSDLSGRVAEASDFAQALDVPVRFSQSNRAAFALLFPPVPDPRQTFSSEALKQIQVEARRLIGKLQRVAERSGASLPEDARSAAAFVAGIAMAGALVPELSESTTLRRRWQDFCLDTAESGEHEVKPDSSSKSSKTGA